MTRVVKSNALINLHYTQLIVHASWPLHWFLRIVRSNITQRSEITLLSWWEVLLTLGVLFCPQVRTERTILTWQGIHCWLLWATMVNWRVTYIGKEKRWWPLDPWEKNTPYPLPYYMWCEYKKTHPTPCCAYIKGDDDRSTATPCRLYLISYLSSFVLSNYNRVFLCFSYFLNKNSCRTTSHNKVFT
jgi:hypothetical protein